MQWDPRHATDAWSDPHGERVYCVIGDSGELSAGLAREPMREGDAILLPAGTEHSVSNPHDDWLDTGPSPGSRIDAASGRFSPSATSGSV